MLTQRVSRVWGVSLEPQFAKLWAGQTVSLLGNQISALGIPLTAVLILGAGPRETGLLAAAGFAPALLFGLAAGAWVDRWPRRPVLIVCDLGRAAVIGLIPLAAVSGWLHMELLYGVAFTAGTLGVFSGLAGVAYLPILVGREHLVQANSRLAASGSVARIAGPGVAGFLIQAVTAPTALVADSASFVVSALAVWAIRVPETERRRSQQSMWRDIGEGLQWLRGNRIIMALVTGLAITNWSLAAVQALYVLYATRQLGVPPATLGLLLAVAGPASLVGALLAGRLAARFGIGPTILAAMAAEAAARLLVPAAGTLPTLVIPLLVVAQAADGLAGPILNINSVSLRQALAPSALQGRVSAAARTIQLGTTPVGAVLAGWLGAELGLSTTLTIAAGVTLVGCVCLVLSPMRALHDLRALDAAAGSGASRQPANAAAARRPRR